MPKLFDIVQKRKQIFEGIMNSLFTSNEIEEIASMRMEICNTCSFLDTEGSKCTVPGTHPCCGHCGCKLKWKVRALSDSCPEAKWEAILSPDEESEVNTKIGYNLYE